MYANAEDDCTARFDRLLALDHSRQEPWGSRHALAFAVFALQHPGRYDERTRRRAHELLVRVVDHGEDLALVVRQLRARGAGSRDADGGRAPSAAAPFPLTIAQLGDFAGAQYAVALERWCRATLEHLRAVPPAP
jgi:hypothetical protein